MISSYLISIKSLLPIRHRDIGPVSIFSQLPSSSHWKVPFLLSSEVNKFGSKAQRLIYEATLPMVFSSLLAPNSNFSALNWHLSKNANQFLPLSWLNTLKQFHTLSVLCVSRTGRRSTQRAGKTFPDVSVRVFLEESSVC